MKRRHLRSEIKELLNEFEMFVLSLGILTIVIYMWMEIFGVIA